MEVQFQDIMSEYREMLAAATHDLIMARAQIINLNREIQDLQENLNTLNQEKEEWTSATSPSSSEQSSDSPNSSNGSSDHDSALTVESRPSLP